MDDSNRQIEENDIYLRINDHSNELFLCTKIVANNDESNSCQLFKNMNNLIRKTYSIIFHGFSNTFDYIFYTTSITINLIQRIRGD